MHLETIAQKAALQATEAAEKFVANPLDLPLGRVAEIALRRLEAIQKSLKRHHGAVIVVDPPEPGVKVLRYRKPNPPRKRRPIHRLPRKLANARRRLERQADN